ncbi:hypothetical protein F5Y03DRAFT_392330 [Xylaria venustula]|nr:hypothetical protein F5Y03DRAFT_392330 [Xylaria venustula]
MKTDHEIEEPQNAFDKDSDDVFGEEDTPLTDNNLIPRTRRPSSWSLKALRVAKDLTSIGLSLFTIAVVYHLLRLSPDVSPSPKSCNCGNSTAEAVARGCEYDELGAAWLPAHCIDRELLNVFHESGDGPGGHWQYWSDVNHTHSMTLEEVGSLADDVGSRFYTTFQWHKSHCFFYLWKIQRSRSTGVTVEARYDNERHTKHCGEMFESPPMPTYSYVTLDSDSEEEPDFVKDLHKHT